MSQSNEPLLGRRASSDEFGQANTRDDRSQQHSPKPQSRWLQLLGWVFAIVATVFVVILAVIVQQQNSKLSNLENSSRPDGKRNLIFMVSDGMGPTSLSLTRSFKQYRDNLPYDDTLTLDAYIIGQSRTRSSSSLITDSAAGATAFSCGRKTYNGAISTLPDHTPCGSVMEAAKRAGYMTGLVVTTRITDATPACFAAHVNMRDQEDRIAEQLLGEHPLGRTVDLMLGAGRCHFLPNETGGCRGDDRDMIAVAKGKGWHYIDSKDGLDHISSASTISLPLLGLFADHDIPYDIDRKHVEDEYPSLAAMSKVALRALTEATKDSEKGFFLMIEGSRIDHAGHANDPSAQVHEVLAYDDAFKEVLSFLDDQSTPGILVATSDHETGGVATARQLEPYVYPKYLWHPSALANASHSVEHVSRKYHEHLYHQRRALVKDELSRDSKEDLREYVDDLVRSKLGVADVTEDEIDLLVDRPEVSPYTFADIVSKRSQTGWSTHGHSAADVNIYASNHNAARKLWGSRENTDVGNWLRWWLDVDKEQDQVDRELKDASKNSNVAVNAKWMGPVPEPHVRLDGQTHVDGMEVDHYTGDFRRYRRCDCAGPT